jgi:hypothetical protein
MIIDAAQQIFWVDRGFAEVTRYPKIAAAHKNLVFKRNQYLSKENTKEHTT